MTVAARALMIQGTSSHAGKSLLVAGLCRLFREVGLRVLPFKSQNMALNAYVTRDGGEMGWAQAMQAEAAGAEPRVEMNPILLKPQSSRGSQVVLLGKVLATAEARDYYPMAGQLWPAVVESYRRLAQAADLIVIEGAGSPAEPNLMAREIANMAVARMARAPVLLVGDIDRGGVFASLLGTLALLKPADRRRVRGFIINKFRGDPSMLTPALRFLERKTRRPVLGVVPMLSPLHLPEEDSVALEEGSAAGEREWNRVRIAVVQLPHIANFTDFAPLGLEPGIELVYARRPADLAEAQLVILPGSKDTIADLRFLKAEGFAAALSAHLGRGGAMGGICGGFQMLGRSVADPHGVESGGEESGLGLLPVTTVLEPVKTTRRVRARLLPGPWGEAPGEWEAYEIHMGRTGGEEALRPLFAVRREGGAAEATDGVITAEGRVWGTYLHGCFDSPQVRDTLGTWLRRFSPARGAAPSIDYRAWRETAYDALAAALRWSLNLPAIRSLIGL